MECNLKKGAKKMLKIVGVSSYLIIFCAFRGSGAVWGGSCKKGTQKDYVNLFKKHHEADIAETLSKFPQLEQQQFFQNIKIELGADNLEEYDITLTPEEVALIRKVSPPKSFSILINP